MFGRVERALQNHRHLRLGDVRNGGSGFLGITQLTFGIFGSAVSLVAMVVVSLITAEPNAATQKMVDEVRVPSGRSILGKQ